MSFIYSENETTHKTTKKYNTPVVGEFHKVSIKQFIKDYQVDKVADNNSFMEDDIRYIYDNVLVLPVRSSEHSAGHDFVITKDIVLNPGESTKVSTGIRAKIIPGWVLIMMPRSGLGTKFRVQLDNTIGVIDGDYFNAKNEGHIMATITNDSKSNKTLVLEAGDRFLQGVFMPYGITTHDEPLGKRTGGHGSSGLK